MVRKNTVRPSMLSLKIVHNLFINKKGITIKDLAKNLKTDYKNVYDCVDFLFKEGIIKKEKIGNYNICKLNYHNKDIVNHLKEYNLYLSLNEFRKEYPTEYRIIMEVCEQILNKKEPFFICLVFGSYARNEKKEGSDVDLLFLTTFLAKQNIKKIFSKINAPYQKRFHVVEQNIRDFIKDLKKMKELSVATEIYKEPPIVFYGDDAFFKIILGVNKLW